MGMLGKSGRKSNGDFSSKNKELYDEYEEILSQAEKVQGSDQSERRDWIWNKKQEVLKKSSSLAYELNDRPQL